MATRKVKFEVEVEYDDEHTDEEDVAEALDILMGTATSTEGVLDEHGVVSVGSFYTPTIIPPGVKY